MTGVQDTTRQAPEPPACPECGKTDHVQKISAIPDMPAEYGPPEEPSSSDPLGVALVLLGVASALAIGGTIGAFVYLFTGSNEIIMLALSVGSLFVLLGAGRLGSKRRQKGRWKEAVSRWQRLHFCARDEVAFMAGGTSTIALHEIGDSLHARLGESADFGEILERAKGRSSMLTCLKCGHPNPRRQTACEECGAYLL
jgi:hypothetical protein